MESFLSIGITKENLDTLTEKALILTPKINYSFPDLEAEYEAYKNFCFSTGVKVKILSISSELEYQVKILEMNFYSKPLSSFAFIKPSNSKHESNKYIYGIKFYDIEILRDKNNLKLNTANIFLYEKCYLLISTHEHYELFEKILLKMLSFKKLNFLKNMNSFSDIFIDDKLELFQEMNNESTNDEIVKLAATLNLLTNTNSIEYITNDSKLELKPSTSFILTKVFSKFTAPIFFTILHDIFLEQQILFIGNDLQVITFSVLLFSKIISPFVWGFNVIPNLPLEATEMIESPVPFIAGIVVEDEGLVDLREYKGELVLMFTDGNAKTEIKKKGNLATDCLYELENAIFRCFWNYDDIESFGDSCVDIISNGIQRGVIEKIKSAIDDFKTLDFDLFKRKIEQFFKNKNDINFFCEFIHTEMFYSFFYGRKN